MFIRFWAFLGGWFAIYALWGPIVYAFYIKVLITHTSMTNSSFRGKLSILRDPNQSQDDVEATLSSDTESFEHIVNITVLLRLLATAAVFILGLRVLNTVRNHVGGSIRETWKLTAPRTLLSEPTRPHSSSGNVFRL
ncbi:hypothetical protein PF005_g30870 [Phytophthora fragariae]|uniref:Uncharacterized protein n=1 Tax=Phytophthora fragariae TaxID=53985 RepID=A0A6A3VK30_9STRA|nr:hypothetical protein PF005_g30870 [Phytophthora fragariae]